MASSYDLCSLSRFDMTLYPILGRAHEGDSSLLLRFEKKIDDGF